MGSAVHLKMYIAEEEMATHSSIPAWRILRTEGPGGYTVHGFTKELRYK